MLVLPLPAPLQRTALHCSCRPPAGGSCHQQSPPACPCVAPQASGGAAEKKRKRAAATDAFDEGQRAQLAALFAQNEYAKTEEKKALAEEMGVDPALVGAAATQQLARGAARKAAAAADAVRRGGSR